jgi:hydroxymethylpyrimidine pyrophosphatase-like HAD family hydrolase
MLQLVAMDLDGTLAEFDNPIKSTTLELLQQLQKVGVKLVLTSGKSASYLAGLVRQSGLKEIIIVGDNGGVIWFSHAFPPPKPIVMEMTPAAIEDLQKVRTALLAEFGDKVWVQPNQVTFSLFGTEGNIEKVFAVCDRVFKEEKIKHLKNFKTAGALDVLPINIDKGVALNRIQKELNIPIKDTAVIGDGSNDFPMFLQGKIRITFPHSAKLFLQLVPKIVPNIDAALKFLLDLT